MSKTRIFCGDIFECSADAIVIPVNTKGVMGAGIALQSRNEFPTNFELYKKCCANRLLPPGGIFVTWRQQSHNNPKALVNLATKDHWRDPSKLEWVVSGLESTANFLNREPELGSVAIPAIGCGLGQLQWEEVLPEISKASELLLEGKEFWIFEPR